VDSFTALSSSLLQLMAKQQQRQQQHQPEQRSTPSKVPPAAEAQAASPLWCSVTTNALFDCTPGSASAAAPPWTPTAGKTAAGSSRLSPIRLEGEAVAAATAGGGGSGSEDYWGLDVDFQPLRASLSAVRASQQHRLTPVQAPHSQQQSAASQLLRQLQEEMQQWFVAHVDGQLCKAQASVNTRGDCVELLKALTHAQQWIQQQQQGTDAANTNSARPLLSVPAPGPADVSCSISQPASAGRGCSASTIGSRCTAGGDSCGPVVAAATSGVAATGSATPPPAAAAGSLSPAALKPGKSPGSQLQQLQVSLRKSLCHLGFLRFQLPA
jgi:hypothetical protein